MEKTVFKKYVNEILVGGGFVRKGSAWYLTSTDAIIVIGLQKSDHAEKFYFNFGIWLRSLGEAEYPKDHKCHISGRLSGLFPEAVTLLDEAGTLNEGSDSKLSELLDFMRREVLPFCHVFQSLSGVRDQLVAGRFSTLLVMRDVKKFLMDG